LKESGTAAPTDAGSAELPQPGALAKARSSTTWKIAAGLVSLASLVWVSLLLMDAWPSLAEQGPKIDLTMMAMGLGLALLASGLTFLAFVSIFRTAESSTLELRELAHLYFAAQLLKHLPGRVWGIGYQWAAGRKTHSLLSWLRANILHGVLATYFALWGATMVLACGNGFALALLSLAGGVGGYFVLWKCASVIQWISFRLGRHVRPRGLLEILPAIPVPARIRLFALFAASWIVYFAGWFFYGEAYLPIGGEAGLQMCALYLLAWFVGYVSLLTPSGLGVRELAFAWLAKDFPPDAVALMAVIGRVGLLAVDLLLGAIFVPFQPRGKPRD
jgi:glycosyltransferase 2 family protein